MLRDIRNLLNHRVKTPGIQMHGEWGTSQQSSNCHVCIEIPSYKRHINVTFREYPTADERKPLTFSTLDHDNLVKILLGPQGTSPSYISAQRNAQYKYSGNHLA